VVDASVTAPLVWVPAAVLVVAGLGKIGAPAAAVEAMRAAGLPAGVTAARAVGAVEAGLGLLALAAPSARVLILTAALYALLAAFAVRLLRAGDGVASCGCFGADGPPSRLHAGFDVLAALALAASAAAPPPGLLGLAVRAPVAGAGLAAGCWGCAYAVSLALRHLPAAAGAYRPRRAAG
jgi:Methylamine utilisation protein MauE